MTGWRRVNGFVPPPWRRQRFRGSGKLAILVLLTGLTLSLHYMVFPFPHWIHLVHRRVCYVPILLGGLWFGLRGGLAVAAVISAVTVPLAVRAGLPLSSNQDLIEIVFYIGLGVLTGVLEDRRQAEQRHKEEERRQNEKLQSDMAESRRLAALGQMAAGIAHEIRTPLGSIQGAAEILERDIPPDHPRRRFWIILQHEANRVNSVVKDFLDLGRPLNVQPHQLSLSPTVNECVGALQGLAGERGVSIIVGPGISGELFADPQRFYQALTNLLRNAIQASSPEAMIRVGAQAGGGGIVITVDDEGPGLPDGEAERIFEPFYSRRQDGTGLGLALVRQILQAHGGWVKAEDLPGAGARFTMYFPNKPPEQEG